MLIDQIKTARMTAMKQKDTVTKTVLTTLLGELEGIAKRNGADVGDELVISTCKKFISANLETIHLGGNLEMLEIENAVLDNFIPKQLTEDELRAIIVDMKATNIGQIMKQLKLDHSGKFDGKMASTISREILV